MDHSSSSSRPTAAAAAPPSAAAAAPPSRGAAGCMPNVTGVKTPRGAAAAAAKQQLQAAAAAQAAAGRTPPGGADLKGWRRAGKVYRRTANQLIEGIATRVRPRGLLEVPRPGSIATRDDPRSSPLTG